MDRFESFLNFRLRIGRLAGIDVFVHWTLIALVLYWFLVVFSENLRDGLLFVMALFLSVFLHELGHCFSARKVGGEANEILMWPLGGLAMVRAPMSPWPQFATTAAGPMVNVVLFLICTPLYLALGGRLVLDWWPADYLSGPRFLMFMVSLNFFLAIFNLIPAFPMDGGRILQAMLWPRLGYRRAMEIAIIAALFCASLMIMTALLSTPPQHVLAAIGIFVIFAAWQEHQRLKFGMLEAEMGLSPWASSLPNYEAQNLQPGPGPIATWREQRRKRRQEADAARLADLRKRLDLVLEKVSQVGMDGLSREERKFLDQASRELRKDRS